MEKKFDVFVDRVDELKKKVARFNKRAERNNLPPLRLEVSEVKHKEAKLTYCAWDPREDVVKRGFLAYCEIQLFGDVPKFPGGWHVVAVLKHTASGTMIYGSDENAKIPEKFLQRTQRCDHCKTKRMRRTTILIASEKNRIKQVGKECLKVYCPEIDAELLMSWAESAFRILQECDEDAEMKTGGYHGPIILALEDFLPVVAAMIRIFGWASRTHTGPRTADEAWEFCTRKNAALDFNVNQITEPDRVRAENAMKWAVKLDPSESDFARNLQTVIKSGVVERKTCGIAAALFVAFDRANRKKEAEKKGAKSKWFGDVGERGKFKLRVNGISGFEGSFGYVHIVRLEDQNENLAVWFASNPPDVEEKVFYEVSATVKAHDEYRGTQQTKLTRCKFGREIKRR